MERAFHRWLKSQIKPNARIKIGIGDDAAVLNSFGNDGFVVSTDTIAEGTHFDLAQHALKRVGRKALAVNLSDIAAMGAIPVAAVLTFMLPRHFCLEQAQQIFSGCQQLAQEFDVEIVGGDTNTWNGPLVVGATIIGCENSANGTSKVWRIDRARPGDQILVSGKFGGSILGHHLDFEPRVEMARYLIENFDVNAATDASDSLSLDLAMMASSSQLGVELDCQSIPVSAAAGKLSQQDKLSPLRHALIDGEDFELIMAVSPAETLRLMKDFSRTETISVIGRFVETEGLVLNYSDGRREEFEPRGYSH